MATRSTPTTGSARPTGRGTFPAGDLVLLCAFDPDLALPRTHQELSRALLQAGYDGPLTRHLIATSPMLQRHGNHYVLQRFTV